MFAMLQGFQIFSHEIFFCLKAILEQTLRNVSNNFDLLLMCSIYCDSS